MNSLLIVGTKVAHSANNKNTTHMVGTKTTGFTQQITQVFNSLVSSILALGKQILMLYPVSTGSTTSITSLAKASIIKTTGCGRMEWI